MTTRLYALLTSLCLSLACDQAPVSDLDAMEPAEPVVDEEPSDDIDLGGGVDDTCAPPRPRPPATRLMFVLDKSSSMGAGTRESAPALLGRPSRWARAHALVEALAVRFDATAQFGATLFPSSYADAGGEAVQCDVLDVPDLPVGDVSAAQLLARLPAADAIDFAGGSPASQAMWTALQHLSRLEGGMPTAIVLVTDGGANCVDEDAPLHVFDEDLVDVVAFARDAMEIPTVVVAADPSTTPQNVPAMSPRRELHELALAGGVPHPQDGYFDVRDPEAVGDAIAELLGVDEAAPAKACP